jgi:hypothetical protein
VVDHSTSKKENDYFAFKLDYFGFTPNLRAIKYAANLYKLSHRELSSVGWDNV